jgi:hypothetical protein
MVADPITQAVMALCEHSSFVPGCEACEIRRSAAWDHLAAMAEAAFRALR